MSTVSTGSVQYYLPVRLHLQLLRHIIIFNLETSYVGTRLVRGLLTVMINWRFFAVRQSSSSGHLGALDQIHQTHGGKVSTGNSHSVFGL